MKNIGFIYFIFLGSVSSQAQSSTTTGSAYLDDQGVESNNSRSTIFVSEDAFDNEDALYKAEKIDSRVYETPEPENTAVDENTDLRDEGYDINSSKEGAAAYQRDFILKKAQQANNEAKIAIVKMENEMRYNEAKIAAAKTKLELKKSGLTAEAYAEKQLKIKSAEDQLNGLKEQLNSLKTKQKAMDSKLGK